MRESIRLRPTRTVQVIRLAIALATISSNVRSDDGLRRNAADTMKRAATYYYQEVATHGGYVYHYSLDLKTRWGEGLATKDQIWIQPPGTPTVGMAFLEAYKATLDPFYLQAARDAAHAVAYGQLKSGGWQNNVDFNPKGERVNLYRNGKGGGKNNSTFDDGQSQSALLFLIKMDEALSFQDNKIHEATQTGLDAVLAAQFPNGGFPQVWTRPVARNEPVNANYPDYNWRTEGRIKNYWDMYTLNDNVTGYLSQVFVQAHQTYADERYVVALKKLGDFLLLAQMPNPQPGWAQQYNFDMQPIWARKFEPPGVSGDETQEVLETLMAIYRYTGDEKYLEPIPAAINWLKKSALPNGQIARYYELKSNRPLYMERQGKVYSLTYDDSNLPDHYGWKTESRIKEIEHKFRSLQKGNPSSVKPNLRELEQRTREVIRELDPTGRWITTSGGEKLVGQPKIRSGENYLSSAVFSDNLTLLSQYLKVSRNEALD